MRFRDTIPRADVALYGHSPVYKCKNRDCMVPRDAPVPRYTRTARRQRSKQTRTHAEPNWDDEMSLFRKRVNSPNQMETMRKIEAEVEVGKVRLCSNFTWHADVLRPDTALWLSYIIPMFC